MATLEAANAYLVERFLRDWQTRFAVEPANATDAHRPVTDLHSLAGSLRHVEARRIANNYTIQFRKVRYQIARAEVSAGMRGRDVRVEARLDGSLALRFEGKYLAFEPCGATPVETAPRCTKPVHKDHNRGARSKWMRDYPLKLGKTRATALAD